MHVHSDDVRQLAGKLNTIVSDVNVTVTDRCSFKGLSSGLVSVQSMFDQINAFTEGMHSLQNLVKWSVSYTHL